jgi:hypothetical protein
MPRPLTRDAGPTPLHTLLGREWERSVGSHYREGKATIKGIRALMVARQHLGGNHVPNRIYESKTSSHSRPFLGLTLSAGFGSPNCISMPLTPSV